MDKYVKRIKRKEDDDTDADKFYVPNSSLWMAADADVACAVGAQQPAAPQKTERPATPPSPISNEAPASLDLSKKTMGKMKRNYVSRRLMFDDEEKVSMKKSGNQQLINNTRPTNVLEEKTTPRDNRYQTIIDSLLARGFVVNYRSQFENGAGGGYGFYGFYGQQQDRRVESFDMERDVGGGGVLSSLVFKCLSIFEGIVYSVHVAAAGQAWEDSAETAKVLAAVGPHPHIVSYYCNWTDERYHYMQMELCQTSLSSLRINSAVDCRTVLEHISCALHYLHDGKMYAHNRVKSSNIYLVKDGDRVVYKLGGLGAATKLPADGTGAAIAAADVQSLCSMVSAMLIDDYDEDGLCSADEEDLRLYLSVAVVGGATNALSIWRWCCGARNRTRQASVPATLYRDDGKGAKDEEGTAAGQTEVPGSPMFKITVAQQAAEEIDVMTITPDK